MCVCLCKTDTIGNRSSNDFHSTVNTYLKRKEEEEHLLKSAKHERESICAQYVDACTGLNIC